VAPQHFRFADYAATDLPELLDLWVASWSEVYAQIDFDERRPWFTGHVASWLREGGLCRVTRDSASGRMAGFILINPRTRLLNQICVGIPWKGRGVAVLLLEEARRLSPGEVRLDVNAMNHRAIRFYERQGFAKTGEGVNPRSGLPIFHYRWQP
jgi:putative acetyltransferase